MPNEEPGKTELLEGEVIQLPPPKKKHNYAAEDFYDALKRIVAATGRSPGVGRVHIETGYKIGENSWLVPDVSIEHPSQPGADYLEGAPLLAVEIISDSNRASDVDRKVKIYLANGAQEVWVVYPKTRCVWVFRQEGAKEFRGVLRSEVVLGMEIDLEAIFG